MPHDVLLAIEIEAEPKVVYDTIASPEGLAAFWTPDVRRDADGELSFGFEAAYAAPRVDLGGGVADLDRVDLRRRLARLDRLDRIVVARVERAGHRGRLPARPARVDARVRLRKRGTHVGVGGGAPEGCRRVGRHGRPGAALRLPW